MSFYRGTSLSNEQFLPTRWIINKPSRKAISTHVMNLRRIRHDYGKWFKTEAIRIGIWPVSFIGMNGKRYKSQNWE